MLEAVSYAHLVATIMMAGLIWFVQVVHYPLFKQIPASHFTEYEALHQKRTSLVVGLFMPIETATALYILVANFSTVTVIGSTLLALIHCSTILLQVPRHRKLSSSFDLGTVQSLVATNWIRTLGWSARIPVALYLGVSL